MLLSFLNSQIKKAVFLSCFMIATLSKASVFGDFKIETYSDSDALFINSIMKAAEAKDANDFLESDCCDIAKFSIPTKKAKVEQQILFSRQDGSWMFQSLVNNGLFEIASSYQPHHPRALLLKGGKIQLSELHRLVSDESILSKNQSGKDQKEGYTLFYPLIIGPDAALIVDSSLELSSDAGAALINRGQLFLDSVSVHTSQQSSAKFRSFILSWNGSLTSIKNSELKNLGYGGYLSSGLTLTSHEKSSKQDAGVLQIDNTVISNSFVGVSVESGQVSLKNNDIEGSHNTGLDIRKSDAFLLKNIVRNVQSGHAVRLVDNIAQHVIQNDFRDSAKSGLLLSGLYGDSLILGNKIQDNGENGLWLDLAKTSKQQGIVIKGNVIANNELSGIKSNCLEVCIYASNLLIGNKRYGFSLENTETISHQLILQRNHFRLNGLASIQTFGLSNLFLLGNQFFFDNVQSKVFVGELEPHQSLIQKSLAKEQQRIRISKEQIQ